MSATETTLEVAQDTVNNLADKNVDSTDSDLRYMAYGARLRTALRASSRYVAYVRASNSTSLYFLVDTDTDQ